MQSRLVTRHTRPYTVLPPIWRHTVNELTYTPRPSYVRPRMQNDGKLWKIMTNEIGRKPLEIENIDKGWKLLENVYVGLITQRSRVQIPPPQPYANEGAVSFYGAFLFWGSVKKNASRDRYVTNLILIGEWKPENL